MKSRLLIIIAFTIMLIGSLVTVSYISEIQQEIWIITGEDDRDPTTPKLTPSILYDYQLMYVVVLLVFGIIGAIIFGISLALWRKRK